MIDNFFFLIPYKMFLQSLEHHRAFPYLNTPTEADDDIDYGSDDGDDDVVIDNVESIDDVQVCTFLYLQFY